MSAGLETRSCTVLTWTQAPMHLGTTGAMARGQSAVEAGCSQPAPQDQAHRVGTTWSGCWAGLLTFVKSCILDLKRKKSGC